MTSNYRLLFFLSVLKGREVGLSLRRSLSAIIALVAASSVGGALTLVVLTRYLPRTESEVAGSVHSIRLVQQIELDLLAHARSGNERRHTELRAILHRDLQEAEQYVETDTERAAFEDAGSKLEIYLDEAQQLGTTAAQDLPELQAALDSFSDLLEINAAEAAQVQAQATHWNDAVDHAALLVATALAIGIVVILVWIWKSAFQPVLDIRQAMTDFAAGNKISRATERGPEELRSIAVQFNQMADTLARQYENQLVFLAGVAHDLRNPLFPLKMSASILEPAGPLPSEERIRSLVAIIRRQVDRLDRMIGDLLDASRIEAGRLELQLQDCDARSLAREVFELFQTASPSHKVEVQLPDMPIHLRCDPFRIEQVMNNLVSNAIKYSPNGGRVQIAVETASENVVFRVSDEGVGIRAEEAPYVFEPFRRLQNSSEIQGTGLGLSIVRRIVETHGGRIELKSEPGKQTTFYVYLPMDGVKAREAA
jgi:two-component system, OmpR family, sensor histidine kinase MtrB